MERKHNHYFKKCPYDYVDVYRVLELFEVDNPCLQHAIKKLLVAGGRGVKDTKKDIQEAIDTLTRKLEMDEERNKSIVEEIVNMNDENGVYYFFKIDGHPCVTFDRVITGHHIKNSKYVDYKIKNLYTLDNWLINDFFEFDTTRNNLKFYTQPKSEQDT